MHGHLNVKENNMFNVPSYVIQ